MKTDNVSRKGVEGTRAVPNEGFDIVPHVCCMSVCLDRSQVTDRQADSQILEQPSIGEKIEVQGPKDKLPEHVREVLEQREKNCLFTYQISDVLTPKNKDQKEQN